MIRCHCEHESHFTGAGHDYLDPHTPAGSRTAIAVGPVCDHCAHTHLAHQLNEPIPGLVSIVPEGQKA